jgi:hypothetical protein
MGLSECVLETLLEDEKFVLYRAHNADEVATVLLLASVSSEPSAVSLLRLNDEFALADLLDVGWAAKPLSLARQHGRDALLLDDAGSRPLEVRGGKPLELARFLTIASERR